MHYKLDIRTLINKFLTGDISDSEILILKKWLQECPENRRVFDEENELWQIAGLNGNRDKFKTEEAWNVIYKKFQFGERKKPNIILINRNKYRLFVAAASIGFLIILGGLGTWFFSGKSQEQGSLSETEIKTLEGEKAHISLADSSKVFMNSGSTLRFLSNFNFDDRVVDFSGEAFFDVKTNEEKPFIVQLPKMSITAKGTSFNILSYENEDRIETTLEEGNIRVNITGQNPINLKAGQQVVYFINTNKAIVRDVSTETYTSWRENKLRFIDTPFEEVLRRIGRRYNVVFEVVNTDLLDYKYTATFIDESIEDVMQMLQIVSPISYRIQNRTSVNDSKYMKPKIIVRKRKSSL